MIPLLWGILYYYMVRRNNLTPQKKKKKGRVIKSTWEWTQWIKAPSRNCAGRKWNHAVRGRACRRAHYGEKNHEHKEWWKPQAISSLRNRFGTTVPHRQWQFKDCKHILHQSISFSIFILSQGGRWDFSTTIRFRCLYSAFYSLWHSRFWVCSLPEGIREHLAQSINPFQCPYDPSLKSCIRQSVTCWHKPASGKKSAINSPSLLWQVPPNNKQIIKAFSFWVTMRIKAMTVHSVYSPELCAFLVTGGNSIHFYNRA